MGWNSPQYLSRSVAVIVRVWRARATKDQAASYAQHATGRVFPELRRLAGHKGALLLTKEQDKEVELKVLTFWSSMEAIEQFAGPSPDVAAVEADAQRVCSISSAAWCTTASQQLPWTA
jgi:hypothetical protein